MSEDVSDPSAAITGNPQAIPAMALPRRVEIGPRTKRSTSQLNNVRATSSFESKPTTVGALAERLQIRHHSAVELVDRLVERDMVARRRDSLDRREVSVTLRPAGEAVLRKLALYSMEELRTEGPELVQVLRRLMPGRARARREQRTARTGGGGTQ